MSKKIKLKFRVLVPTTVWVIATVEAASEEDAEELAAHDGMHLTGFAGNGGYDKLVGVSGSNLSVEPDEPDWDLVTIEKVEE